MLAEQPPFQPSLFEHTLFLWCVFVCSTKLNLTWISPSLFTFILLHHGEHQIYFFSWHFALLSDLLCYLTFSLVHRTTTSAGSGSDHWLTLCLLCVEMCKKSVKMLFSKNAQKMSYSNDDLLVASELDLSIKGLVFGSITVNYSHFLDCLLALPFQICIC